MSINLLMVYSRSGGTLLNQCLAALPNTVVISEVSQRGGGSGNPGSDSKTTVWEQAASWYGIHLENRDFVAAILELDAYCSLNNLHLIIRDWTYASFASASLDKHIPSRSLETLNLLSGKAVVRPFCFIRNVIDVWISSGRPNIKTFFSGYQSYLQQVRETKMPLFKYEELCANPDAVMKEICSLLKIPFDACYRNNYANTNVNGDTQLGKRSRGIRQQAIAPLPRKFISPMNIIKINQSMEQQYCNSSVGYETTYFNSHFNVKNYLESGWAAMIDKVKNQCDF